jgi:predicted DNA-binding transcriptional regulator YafY
MKSNTDYAAILDQLPLVAAESVWLGALLTVHFSGGEVTKEARRLLDGLEAIRARTLESSAGPASLGNATAKSMAPCSDADSLRQALVHEYKLKIFYKNKSGRATERVVWPLDTEPYGPKGAMLCWCEERQDFRHFRFDRIQQLIVLQEKTDAPRKVMANFAQISMSDDF